MAYYSSMSEKPKGRERIALSYESSGDLRQSWEDRSRDNGEGTYARAGYRELREREHEIAEMIGVPDTALFNAGMAAIATVLEAEGLHQGDAVLCGKGMYGETKDMVISLAERGVRVVQVDSGDIEEIANAIETERPRLIILETTTNSVDMRVSDIGALAELIEQAENRYRSEYNPGSLLEKYLMSREYAQNIPFEARQEIIGMIDDFRDGSNPMVLRGTVHSIEEATHLSREEAIRETSRLVKYILREERGSLTLVLDNTLSSPVLRNPLDEVNGHDATIIVVESGTKHFQEGKDQITLGVVYTNDEGELKRIKEKRTEMGTYLQPVNEALLPEQLTERVSEIVKRQANHALALATLLEHLPGVEEVNHPNLSSHRDNELVQELAPEGLVTLFYIKVANPMEFVDKVKKVAGNAIEIGTSFGHEKTRLSPRPNKGEVRIAAGSESDEEFAELVRSFKTALI